MLNAGNETVSLHSEGFNATFKGFVKQPILNASSGMEIMSMIMNYSTDQRKHQLAAITDCITFETEREIHSTSLAAETTLEKSYSTFSIVKLLGAELLTEDPNHVLLQEGPSVSRSVLTLMSAINYFSTPSKNPSFDLSQSNLTQILHPSLGGNSIVSCLVFLRASEKWEKSIGVLKVSHKIGKMSTFPIPVTTGIRNLMRRVKGASWKEVEGGEASKQSALQQEHQILKRDFELLQGYVLDLTTRLSTLQVTNACLEASCKTTEKDRLSMKTELLDSKIELSRSLEKLESANNELTTKLYNIEHKATKLEKEGSVAVSKKTEIEDLMKMTIAERDKVIKTQLEQETKRTTSLSSTIKHLELKNKELTVELVGILNNKSSCESSSGTFKSELERLKKHNEYLKKKIETSQKSSFNMGHEIERLLQSEQEKLRKEVAAQHALKRRISEVEASNEELNANLELFKETYEAKHLALHHAHETELQTATSRIDTLVADVVALQQANETLKKEVQSWQRTAEERAVERKNLQAMVERLQNEHNVAMEGFRSKLDRLTADVLTSTKKGGKNSDTISTANQLFKEMLDSYVTHEKQLKEELDKARQLLKMLSRAKPAIPATPPPAANASTLDKKRKVPKLEHFIAARDYTGAITILEFSKAIGKFDYDTQLWLGYTNFHLGDYRKSMELYQSMLQDPNCDPLIHLYLACCYFFLGMYKEADESAQRGPTCKLQNRLLFHLSHKFNDEKRLMGYHGLLHDVVEDQ
ncbi:Intraflagellar transport protein 56, partial [Podochytrium sp. JEL0797]